MAEAVVTVTVRQVILAGALQHVFGSLAVSAAADTYDEGGLDVNLNNPLIKSSRAPIKFTAQGRGTAQVLFEYRYVPGTNNTNGLLRVFGSGANADDPLSELADNAAIPAGVSGDTIEFEAVFLGQL
jgi:hypothetical protein